MIDSTNNLFSSQFGKEMNFDEICGWMRGHKFTTAGYTLAIAGTIAAIVALIIGTVFSGGTLALAIGGAFAGAALVTFAIIGCSHVITNKREKLKKELGSFQDELCIAQERKKLLLNSRREAQQTIIQLKEKLQVQSQVFSAIQSINKKLKKELSLDESNENSPSSDSATTNSMGFDSELNSHASNEEDPSLLNHASFSKPKKWGFFAPISEEIETTRREIASVQEFNDRLFDTCSLLDFQRFNLQSSIDQQWINQKTLQEENKKYQEEIVQKRQTEILNKILRHSKDPKPSPIVPSLQKPNFISSVLERMRSSGFAACQVAKRCFTSLYIQ